jgi:hypothetical protein
MRKERAQEVSPSGYIVKPVVERKFIECIGAVFGPVVPYLPGA